MQRILFDFMSTATQAHTGFKLQYFYYKMCNNRVYAKENQVHIVFVTTARKYSISFSLLNRTSKRNNSSILFIFLIFFLIQQLLQLTI